MKIGDKVTLKNDNRIGTIVGMVPFHVNPVAHYSKVQGMDFSKKYVKQMTSNARQVNSWLVAVDDGKYKDGSDRPGILLWPKNENISLYVEPEVTEDEPKPRKKGRK